MEKERREEEIVEKYGFDFEAIPKQEIISLIENEMRDFQQGSSEYIRVLCGYLYCLGDETDVPLLEKVKYGINMDVGCMIDAEWINSLKNGGIKEKYTRTREEIINDFIGYYKDFKNDIQFIYNRLKDKHALILTNAGALKEMGFTIDVPILYGESKLGKFWLYAEEPHSCDCTFVFDVEYEKRTWFRKRLVKCFTHWHPRSIEQAIDDVDKFMSGELIFGK